MPCSLAELGRAPQGTRKAQLLWGYLHYFVFAAIAAVGAGLALCVAWLADAGHMALPDWGVAMVVGAAVAVFLLTMVLIEGVAEGEYIKGAVFRKLGASFAAIASALVAPFATVPGSIGLIGLVLAAIVVYGVVLQHRLHLNAQLQIVG